MKNMPTAPTPALVPIVIDSGLRDNYTRGTVADFLKEKVQDGSRLSVVSAYFTIYAYDALRDYLDRIDHLDFLFGEPSFVNRLDPSKTEKKAFLIGDGKLQLANGLQQKRVARECADWIARKVDIRTVVRSNLLHGKMYHIARGGVEDAILGSSNFTVRGLGLGVDNNNIELNLIVDGNRDRQELKRWFDELWLNDTLVKDVDSPREGWS
jgi:phosphatidylserine/phosphatidylglycerophosphate/cardiolipin synthase-like enzyme